MELIDAGVEGDVRTRTFEIERDGQVVPGVVWSPAEAPASRAKVLLCHGGTQDKFAPNIVALARSLVDELGFACVAIDAPGHGDRVSAERREQFRRAAMQIDPTRPRHRGEPTDPYTPMFVRGAQDWAAVLDSLDEFPEFDGPTGWWGVSMGVSIGLPFVSSDPRIDCAVLGLASTLSRPGHEQYLQWARRYDRPLLFLSQRDDGGHPIENALELFDLFGSRDKTFHLNPGPHVGVPGFEREASVRFFARHLLESGKAGMASSPPTGPGRTARG